MSDHDRDIEGSRESAVNRDSERIRDTERTTIIQTDGGRDRGGGSGMLIAVVLLLVLLGGLFFLFRGGLGDAADKVGVNVNVDAPKVSVPDKIKIDVPDNVKLPDVDVKSDGNSSK